MKIHVIYKIQWIISVLMLFFISCPNNPTKPKPIDYETTLSIDYSGPSFVSLYFSISDSGESRQYAIKRDTTTVLSGILKGKDTIITDWTAEPATNYNYQLLLLSEDEILDKSDTVTTTTMDTTSHNFIWEKIIFCETGSCTQIKMINENNVWIAGQFEPELDTGYIPLYNTARFNGDDWTLYTYFNRGGFRDIFIFNENDLWAMPYTPVYYNGSEWILYHLENMNVIKNNEGPMYKMWGPSSDNMYFIGDNVIVHYDGIEFTKFPNMPGYNYYRIDGAENPEGDIERIWVGTNGETDDLSKRGGMMYYDGIDWEVLWNHEIDFFPDPAYKEVGGIWTSPDDKWVVFTVGGYTDQIVSIHNQKYIHEYQSKSDCTGFFRSIHGNNINDFFMVGDKGNVVHYNGKTFQEYNEFGDGRLISVAQYGDVVYVACQSGAIVYRGVRQ